MKHTLEKLETSEKPNQHTKLNISIMTEWKEEQSKGWARSELGYATWLRVQPHVSQFLSLVSIPVQGQGDRGQQYSLCGIFGKLSSKTDDTVAYWEWPTLGTEKRHCFLCIPSAKKRHQDVPFPFAMSVHFKNISTFLYKENFN